MYYKPPSKQQQQNRSKYFRLQRSNQAKQIVVQPIWIAKLKTTLQQYFCTFFEFKQGTLADKIIQMLIIFKKFCFSIILNYYNKQISYKSSKQESLEVTKKCHQISLQQFKIIEKQIIQYETLCNTTISTNYNKQKSLYQILQKYQLQQISKIQSLSISQKLFRLELVSKVFNFQIQKQTNYEGFLQNLRIFIPKVYYSPLQEKNVNQIMQNYKHLCNEQFKNKLTDYLFSFYQQFKQKVSFFPPKISLKDINFNLQTEKFSINFQWAILWSLGLIQKPINLQNKIADNLITTDPDQEIIGDSLFYINPLWKKQYQQQKSLKEKVLNSEKQNNLWQKLQKLTEQKYKVGQYQILLNQLQILKQSKKSDWQDIEEFIAVINLLMLIFEITFMIPFDIVEQLKQNNALYQLQMQNKTFPQKKLQFACQCFSNNLYLWTLFLSCIQNQILITDRVQKILRTQKILNFKVLKQIFTQKQIKQTKFQFIKRTIKITGQIYLTLLKNISFPESVMLVSVHNAVRYLSIILIAKIYQIDILYFPQIQQKQVSCQLKNIYKIQEIVLTNKKINKFLSKSNQKIRSYVNNPNQNKQNARIIQVKANKQARFVRQISQQNFSGLTYKDLSLKRKQILQNLISFISEFIYNVKILKYKELQIDFQFRLNLTPQNKQQEILKFCIESFLMNFNFLQLILLQIKYTKIGQIFFTKEGNSKIQEILQNNLTNNDLKNTLQILIFTSLQFSLQIQKAKNQFMQQLKNSKQLYFELQVLQQTLSYQQTLQNTKCFFGFGQIKKLRRIIMKGLEQNYLKYVNQWKLIKHIIDKGQLKLSKNST